MRLALIGRAVIALALAACAGCKNYGASSGPNPNMEALNAPYGITPPDPRADEVPLFLYYPDVPRPQRTTAPNLASAATGPESSQG